MVLVVLLVVGWWCWLVVVGGGGGGGMVVGDLGVPKPWPDRWVVVEGRGLVAGAVTRADQRRRAVAGLGLVGIGLRQDKKGVRSVGASVGAAVGNPARPPVSVSECGRGGGAWEGSEGDDGVWWCVVVVVVLRGGMVKFEADMVGRLRFGKERGQGVIEQASRICRACPAPEIRG